MTVNSIKTATVAACSGVVGKALVENLLRSNVKVVGFCRPENRNKIADIEKKAESKLVVIDGDMADPANCKSLVSNACEALNGKIDAHFHAVGYYVWSKWIDIGSDAIDRLWRANYTTAWALGREIFTAMSQRNAGSILFVSARDTQTFAPIGFGPYLASKAAVNMLVQSMAAEGKEIGIRVNAVLPTIIDTEVNRRAMPDQDPNNWVNPDRLAKLMIDLCGPDRSDISGALIPVNSGIL